MTDEERTGVRHMINQTIERLQRASVGANQMGSRYARLLQLLWRKNPKRNGNRDAAHQPTVPYPNQPPNQAPSNQDPNQQSQQFDQYGNMNAFGGGLPGIGGNGNGNGNGNGGGQGFSWLDLGATWNFATQNGNSSGGSAGELTDDGGLGGANELSPFDMGLLSDYSLLEGDNPNLIF